MANLHVTVTQGTSHPESWVQSILVTQVYSSHSRSASSTNPLIVLLDCLLPEFPHFLRTVLSKSDIDQEIAVAIIWLEVRSVVISGLGIDGSGE